MKNHSLVSRSIVYFAIACMTASISCNARSIANSTPTVAPTPMLEKLRLINGELDACQLINLTEIEAVLRIKVVSENLLLDVSPGCKYVSMTDDRILLLTSVTTDATIERANQSWLKKYNSTEFFSPVELYEMYKESSLKLSEIAKTEDIENFGDQAFLHQGVFLEIHVLNNEIYYQFFTRVNGGIGYDALMELAQVALQRMP